MTTLHLKFCELTLKKTHAILMMHSGTRISMDVVMEIRKHLYDYYKDRDFILITDRRNNHKIDLSIYKNKTMKNMKGIAVVSSEAKEIERAMQEQSLWNNSFAFFTNVAEAEDWALTFFD
ncbi:hypothetical protein [Aquimarina rhabdastrellae]